MSLIKFVTDEDFLSYYRQLEVPTKICIKCNRELPENRFSLRDRGAYRRTECNECRSYAVKITNKLREENEVPEGHICPICMGTAEEVAGLGGKNNVTFCLDHDHATNLPRGFLCHPCNRGLGAFKDDIQKLRRALNYLEDFQKKHNL